MFRFAWILALLGAAGCGEVVSLDAGLTAGSQDAGPAMDAGAPDTGIALDSGMHPDATPTDAETPDAAPDAGFPDAEVDAGPMDADVDAGPSDAGPTLHRLALVFVGDGQGTVTWPDGTSCATNCERMFEAGQAIEIVAAAGLDSSFVGWSPQGCPGTGTCTLRTSSDQSIEVTFGAIYDVTVLPQGPGLGRIDGLGVLCAPGCSVRELSGTQITVTPVSAAGVQFAGWAGPCSASPGACTITVSATTNLQPTWQVLSPRLGQAPGGHLCALLGPRSVRCWGNGGLGQLGRQSNETIGDDETVASQGDLPLGLDVVQVETGGTFSCVLQKSGSVRCWGLNDFGQLGQGNTVSVGQAGGVAPANLPDILVGQPVLQIALGGWHACALLAGGSVRCWGRGQEGQLGYGNTNNVADGSNQVTSPELAGDIDFGSVPAAVSIATGAYHSCAVFEDGSARCWGSNGFGQLGYPFGDSVGDGNAQRPLPRDASALPLGVDLIAEIRAGTEFTCARFINGRMKCWGRNSFGQLGTGNLVQVGGLVGTSLSMGLDVGLVGPATALAVGADHSCAIVGGQAYCWGQGVFGKLGSEAISDRTTPFGPLLLGTGRVVAELGISGPNTCAVVYPSSTPNALEARCWGKGTTGALGNGTVVSVGDLPGTMPPSPTPLF